MAAPSVTSGGADVRRPASPTSPAHVGRRQAVVLPPIIVNDSDHPRRVLGPPPATSTADDKALPPLLPARLDSTSTTSGAGAVPRRARPVPQLKAGSLQRTPSVAASPPPPSPSPLPTTTDGDKSRKTSTSSLPVSGSRGQTQSSRGQELLAQLTPEYFVRAGFQVSLSLTD